MLYSLHFKAHVIYNKAVKQLTLLYPDNRCTELFYNSSLYYINFFCVVFVQPQNYNQGYNQSYNQGSYSQGYNYGNYSQYPNYNQGYSQTPAVTGQTYNHQQQQPPQQQQQPQQPQQPQSYNQQYQQVSYSDY